LLLARFSNPLRDSLPTMQATNPTSVTDAARKPVGPLALYKNRLFLSANESSELELIAELKTLYGLDELEIEVATLQKGEKSKEFRYVEVPGLPRIYLIQLLNHSTGIRRVTDAYELAVYDGGATEIVYVHETAMTLFKLATLHVFPCVLFHNDDEFKSYLRSKFIGDDTKEINFYLAQQQEYVRTEIKPREVFAEHKKEVKEQRDQRRPAAQESKSKEKGPAPPKKNSAKEKGPAPKKSQAQKGAGEKTRQAKKPVDSPDQSKRSTQGWAEVTKNGRSEKSREATPDSPPTAEPEQRPKQKSAAGAYVEALTRPASREGRQEVNRPADRPQWSLPADVAPVVPVAVKAATSQAAVPQAGSMFGNGGYAPWQQAQAPVQTVFPSFNTSQQITPELMAMVQTLFAQQQANAK